uniref:G patch domain-containing protein 4 n=1 Tax=Glossina brevipalpis TaxID=37001 RepID=A0A1A9WZ28_9MUSC
MNKTWLGGVSFCMDFAKKILKKYGWKEGDGLGKKSNGIAKALRPALKFDKAGFGADLAANDFNNHWWERVFNEAASNVNVDQKVDGGVEFTLRNKGNGIESSKGYSLKKQKNAKNNPFGNFLQTSTLKAGGMQMDNLDKIKTADLEVAKVSVMTDEELFAACHGRTTHKGARHGLKLTGKLSRLQKQEEDLLANMQANEQGRINGDALLQNIKEKQISKIVSVVTKRKRKKIPKESLESAEGWLALKTTGLSTKKRKCEKNMQHSSETSEAKKEGTNRSKL